MIKNQLFTIMYLILSVTVFSQVGVNTSEPNGNSFLHISEQNLNNPKAFKGVLLAKYTQEERDAEFVNFTENEEGLIIYNLTQGCFNYWRHNKTTDTGVWTIYGECKDNQNTGNVNLDCDSSTFESNTVNDNYGTLTIPYTNGDGGAYSQVSIESRGVEGLTITLSTGNFAVGSGELIFSISGTPIGSGIASFDIEIGGVSCTASIPISNFAFDCLNVNETKPVIPYRPGSATSILEYIPYINGNGSAYDSYTTTSTGVTGLTLRINAGNLVIGDGSIPFYVEGRPNGVGEARFLIEILGAECEVILDILPSPIIDNLNCSNPIFSSAPIVGSDYIGTVRIGYTNGNGGIYNPIFVESQGVTDLTMVSYGRIANGDGELVFNIRGTPSSSGNATFDINFFGKTCTIVLPVINL